VKDVQAQVVEEDEHLSKVEALAKLPPELALIKMENDSIQALAAARPRNYLKIKQDLLAQLEAYPSFSREAIYSKPVGKNDAGIMQYARGPSIRMAEACAEAYGYNRVRCDMTIIDDDHVQLVASFVDYQRGRIWQDSGVVSKFFKMRGGQMRRMADDRFFDVKVKAEKSKLVREVILRSIPPGLRADLVEAAERQIENLLDDATIRKIVGQFASKGITLEHLEAHIGRTLKAGWTKEDRKNLLGLWNAVESGEITPDSITSDGAQAAEGQKETPLPSAEDALKGATVTSKPHADPAKAELEALADSMSRNVSSPQPGPTDAVTDLILSLDSLSSKREYEAFLFDQKAALKSMTSDQQSAVLEAYQSFGKKKGWRN